MLQIKYKSIYVLFCLSLLCWQGASAQQQIVGRVISFPEHKPLSGATLNIGNPSFSMQTNADGEFKFTAPEKPVRLMVSYLGYQTLDTVLNGRPEAKLLLVLKPVENQLDEVMVNTGYQQLPKDRATGSFALVNNAKFNEQVGTDVLSRLEGLASGLSVDRKSNRKGIMIRGLSTLSGPQEPLIILDNFPYEGDLNNINPNDVESVTVLKDAAAASIWGAKAGNGVLVITTKKAAFNRPLSVNLHSNLTTTEKPDLTYMKMLNSADFIAFEKLLFAKGYYSSLENPSSRKPLTPVLELLIAQRDGTMSNAAVESSLNLLSKEDVLSNYSRDFYRDGLSQQYALNMSAGSKTSWWSFLGGYDRNAGNLNEKYSRVNLNVKNNWQLTNRLTALIGLNYTSGASQSGNLPYGSTQTANGALPPYTKFTDGSGHALPVMYLYRPKYINALPGSASLLDWNYYPYDEGNLARQETSLQDILMNMGVKYKLASFLNAELAYQYERQSLNGNNYYDEQSYYTRDLVNTFTKVNGSTVTRPVPIGTVYDQSFTNLNRNNLRGQLNLDHQWRKHQISALAGAEVRETVTTASSSRRYGYDQDLMTSVNMDYANTYPKFIDGLSTFINDNRSQVEDNNRYLSYYGNAAYTYDSKYTISASARKDASNLFGLNTNEKWNPFWSAGVLWNIANESFYRLNFLPQLKFRSTYGLSGNVNQDLAAVTTIGYGGVSPFTQSPYANFKNYSNPDLRWESVATLNLGIDFGIKGNRLEGSIEYYRKWGRDLFSRALIDVTTGIGSTITKNAASMQANGMDLLLRSSNIRGKFAWDTDLNFSYYTDKITDYYIAQNTASSLTTTSNLAGVVGKPVYSLFSYQWAGLDPQNGNPLGYVNGKPSTDYTYLTASARTVNDVVYEGMAMPAYFGAIGNNFSYKNLSLAFRISAKMGYYFRRTTINYSNFAALRMSHSDYNRRWLQPGDEQHTTVPSFVYPTVQSRDTFYQYSEATVEKGDHIRMQYINLSYNLTGAACKWLPFKSAQIYAVANNIGLLWTANSYGLDPDYPAAPPAKTLSFGIKINP